MFSAKHIAILLMISHERFAEDYTLIKILDRIWFPCELRENIDYLVLHGMIQPYIRQSINHDYRLTPKAEYYILKNNIIEQFNNDVEFSKAGSFEKEFLNNLYNRLLEDNRHPPTQGKKEKRAD